MATEHPPQQRPPRRNGNRRKVVIAPVRGSTVLVILIGVPMIWIWLFLALKIILGSLADAETLDNIEGLLTAFAVLTIPATEFLRTIVAKWKGDAPSTEESE
jgi:hypothetical protein